MLKATHALTMLGLLTATACADDASASKRADPLSQFGRTRGGAVVLSRDESIAVATNRSAGVVTVVTLDPTAALERLVQRRIELDMGAGCEPWAAVIGADDDVAYVICRREQSVTRIIDLHGKPRLDKSLTVGSEPTSIAIAPSGLRLFVANWGDGTISVVTTPDFKRTGDYDLNEALVATGVLGDVESRAGLSHPRALAITDDGDDDDGDETLYATEFFSMPLLDADRDAAATPEPGYFDRNRQGFVYPIQLGKSDVGAPIALGAVDDTGLVDSNGATTGCFPNQLYAVAANADRLWVTSMCASPEGPLGPVPDNPANFKTVVLPALFAIDTHTNRELPAQRQILSYEVEQRYIADQTTTDLRMPLIPNDLAFTPPPELGVEGKQRGCITAMGADAVFCTEHDAKGRVRDIGMPGKRYIDLAASDQPAGRLPIGIALSRHGRFGLVVNDNSQNLSVIDLAGNTVRQVEALAEGTARAAEVRDSDANEGHLRFATGLDVWSFQGAAWNSCEGCHPDGQSDGVTWFFARGPRRTISTAGTYDAEGARRLLLWTANVDEVHDVEGIVRTVAGGVGGVTWKYDGSNNDARIIYDGSAVPPGKPTGLLHNNLNSSLTELLAPASSDQVCNAQSEICDHTPVHAWDLIDAFIRSVRAPRSPAVEPAQVGRGAGLFRDGRCSGCHGGPDWTLSRVFYTPSAPNNGALPSERPESIYRTQLGRLRTETYNVPDELLALNPPGASGTATFRRWDPGDRDWLAYLYGTEADDGYDSRKTHANDQINCALRAVGTFGDDAMQGVVPAGSPIVVRELRQDMKTPALGATGFNVPSLVGVAAGAPYFHAGNARTLEELFDPAFARHYQALAPSFLQDTDPDRAAHVRDLVAYLLTIDDDRPTERLDPKFDLCVSSAGAFE